MKLTLRQRAARKAARTRASNRAAWKRYYEVEEPAIRRTENLINHLLSNHGKVSLLFNPTKDVGRKLKNGAKYGTLIKFLNGGRLWRVLPDGYSQPQDFHPAFWEPLI